MLKSKLSILGFSIGKKKKRHQANNTDGAHRAIKGYLLYINFCETPNLKPKCKNESGRQRRTSCTITLHISVYCLHFGLCTLQFAPQCSLAAHWSQTQSRKKPESRETPLNWVEDSSKNISFTGASKSQNSLHRWRARLCTLRWSSLKRRQKIWGQEWKKGDGKYGSQSEGNRIPECIALQVSLCKSTRVKSKLLRSSSSFRGGAFTSLHLTFHN